MSVDKSCFDAVSSCCQLSPPAVFERWWWSRVRAFNRGDFKGGGGKIQWETVDLLQIKQSGPHGDGWAPPARHCSVQLLSLSGNAERSRLPISMTTQYSTKASNWNEELAWLDRREKVCIWATLGREFSFPSRVASTATDRNHSWRKYWTPPEMNYKHLPL